MKRALLFVFSAVILTLAMCPQAEVSAAELDIDAKSCILMEMTTGTVLYEYNADEALPPASVTKIMTILIVMDAIDDGMISSDDIVTVSANAASMGGSQVYLEAGEEMSVGELLKCVIIASANDAAVALAEYVSGSESAFVERMNERAAGLGMTNTHFVNTNGLDDSPDAENHLTSARDIAIMSCELMTKHPEVTEYTTVWMDTIRNGEFGLTNTNRLIRFYRGATGLKTGSTSKAGFCISATAERDGMQLVAVIMGSPTRDVRNEAAKTLLDYGYANYSLYTSNGGEGENIAVTGGKADTAATEYASFSCVLGKGKAASVTEEITINKSAAAPLSVGDVVGEVTYTLDGEVIGSVPVTVSESVERIGYLDIIYRMFLSLLGAG
ncbi:MAG: D-alanyl-D-alanine carboxypeptidase [Firmicutes bacterium]|nr:D-alanyl-D-alanine carboxypeptidase [Bacillota bacterium]